MRSWLLCFAVFSIACGRDDDTPAVPPDPDPDYDTGLANTPLDIDPPSPGTPLTECDPGDLDAGTEAAQPVRTGSIPDEVRFGHGSTSFSSVVHVGNADPCSNSFSDQEYCYNASNPPSPSILRPVGMGLRSTDDHIANRYGKSAETPGSKLAGRRPDPGDTVLPPFEFQTADARLLYNGNYGHWPSFGVYRPEHIGFDHTLREDTAPADYPANAAPDYGPLSNLDNSIHTLAVFDPQNTGFRVAGRDADPHVRSLLGSGQPIFLHTTVCEDTSDDAAGGPRTPYPCSARYGKLSYEYDPSAPAVSNPWGTTYENWEERSGLCYDVSVLGGVSANATSEEKWELRSSALTVFVPNAYTEAAGVRVSPAPGVWVYPQNPANAVQSAAPGETVVLPDFADYDLEKLFPWDQIREGDNVDIGGIGVDATFPITGADGNAYDVPNRCYVGGNPASDAPPWCEFLFGQEANTSLYFDVNRDAIPDRNTSAARFDGIANGAAENLFEPITTADGRLLVMNSNIGVMYSTSTTPCSANGFEYFLPYSLMPKDPEIRSRYSVGQTALTLQHPDGEPFRDPYGNFIPFGSIQRFAYPWIDRDGRNLFLAANNEHRDAWTTTNVEREWVDQHTAEEAGVAHRDPNPDTSRPIEGAQLRDHLATQAGHSISFVGAWSGHKMVIVDGGLNASDFGGGFGYDSGVEYAQRFVLPLYNDAAMAFVPKGATEINSIENRLNHFEALRPTLPFDVVWTMASNNQHSSELAFDDFMNPDALVVAPMNATAKIIDTPAYRSNKNQSAWAVEDGFLPDDTDAYFTSSPGYEFSDDPEVISGTRHEGRVLLQNAAGFSHARVQVIGGARTEPIALGGVLGRGVYLDGNNDAIRASLAGVGPTDFYTGIWVDDRRTSGRSAVFTLPDGSVFGIERSGDVTLFASEPDGTMHEVDIGARMPTGTFTHLGLRVATRSGTREADVFLDGTRIATFAVDAFDLSAGPIVVGIDHVRSVAGGSIPPVRGWVDEWKVFELSDEAAVLDTWFEEVACNHALGTLVDGNSSAGQALGYGTFGATRVCENLVLESTDRPIGLAPQHGRTTCASEVHRSPGADCLRADALEFEPLVADAVRPSTRGVGFCESCHDARYQVQGLRPSALDEGTVPRWLDPRRQPLDPPAVLALPEIQCDEDWSLDGTWYATFATHGTAVDDDPVVFTDRVFDGALVPGGPFLPPQ